MTRTTESVLFLFSRLRKLSELSFNKKYLLKTYPCYYAHLFSQIVAMLGKDDEILRQLGNILKKTS